MYRMTFSQSFTTPEPNTNILWLNPRAATTPWVTHLVCHLAHSALFKASLGERTQDIDPSDHDLLASGHHNAAFTQHRKGPGNGAL